MEKVLVLNLTPRLGMLQYSSQFCNELNKSVDLRVVIADYYEEDLYDKKIRFIKIKTNPTAKDFVFNTFAFWRQIKLFREIKKFNPSIVHFLDNHPWYEYYCKKFKKLGYKIYVTQHDPTLHSGENISFQGKIAIRINKILRENADKIFVHGEKLKKELIDKYNIPKEKVISIVHGNFNFLKDRFSKGGKLQKNSFVFFGRIVDYKGLDILLESLKIVKEKIPDFKLIIAGPGSIEKYEELLLKYKENIDLFNFDIPSNEIYKYIEKGEFVVLPYNDATGSGVIPLAYAFSKPVIVTDVGELASVVIEEKTGFVIKKQDITQLGIKIIYMLENKNKVIEMGKNGRKYSDDKLGWDGVVKKIYF